MPYKDINRRREYWRYYCKLHPDRIRKTQSKCFKKYYANKNNQKKHLMSSKKYYDNNKEKVKIRQRNYYQNNKEKVCERTANYYKLNIKKYRSQHKRYNIKHKEKINTFGKNWHYDKRLSALKHYSNGVLKCVCCGESIYDFLTIDHINGGGNVHRRKIKTNRICAWLVKNNFPKGFQVLCSNCNLGKYKNNGVCPHKVIKSIH